MHKIVRLLWAMVLVLVLFASGILLADKYSLRNELVRLHVVADSDGEEDQKNKLAVRDAVLSYLQTHMPDVKSAKEAKEQLKTLLPELEVRAQQTLESLGCRDSVHVSLTREAFGVRHYDTFSLPSGVYDALRVDIGEAEGQNWWCVVFPSLCMSATTDTFVEDAVAAGINDGLAQSLTKESDYKIRFFLLDCLGKLENFLHIQ